MKTRNKPLFGVREVYEECLNGMRDSDVKTKLKQLESYFVTCEVVYKLYVKEQSMHLIESNSIDIQKKYEIEKKDIVNLYKLQLSKSGRKARIYYDSIKSISRMCPYCELGLVFECDHYLPKEEFPEYAILPINLIPSCRDCNKEKAQKHSQNEGEQFLHPYFDSSIINKKWLKAVVAQPDLNITFEVDSSKLNDTESQRVNYHLSKLKLDNRFSSTANSELSELNHKFIDYDCTSQDIKNELKFLKSSVRHKGVNYWKYAMYEALYNSSWYCSYGYKII